MSCSKSSISSCLTPAITKDSLTIDVCPKEIKIFKLNIQTTQKPYLRIEMTYYNLPHIQKDIKMPSGAFPM